jgi:antitoxin VbhA-like protein
VLIAPSRYPIRRHSGVRDRSLTSSTRCRAGNGTFGGRPTRPDDELAQRFARGDIDATEYHQRLDALRATAGESNPRV